MTVAYSCGPMSGGRPIRSHSITCPEAAWAVLPVVVALPVVAAVALGLTTVASNTATAAMMIPLAIPLAGILGIDLNKIFRLYPDFGNIGPAGVQIALSKLEQSGRLHRGQRIALIGIGSGINCTMAELIW